jgi:hypothetical protein
MIIQQESSVVGWHPKECNFFLCFGSNGISLVLLTTSEIHCHNKWSVTINCKPLFFVHSLIENCGTFIEDYHMDKQIK